MLALIKEVTDLMVAQSQIVSDLQRRVAVLVDRVDTLRELANKPTYAPSVPPPVWAKGFPVDPPPFRPQEPWYGINY